MTKKSQSTGAGIARVTRLFVPLCAVAALSGCTVPIVGLAGIGVDQDGRPVGYLAVCDEHIDGATLYFQGPDVAPTSAVNETDAGTWTANTPITSSAAWLLAEPPDGWAATTPSPTCSRIVRTTCTGGPTTAPARRVR